MSDGELAIAMAPQPPSCFPHPVSIASPVKSGAIAHAQDHLFHLASRTGHIAMPPQQHAVPMAAFGMAGTAFEKHWVHLSRSFVIARLLAGLSQTQIPAAVVVVRFYGVHFFQ